MYHYDLINISSVDLTKTFKELYRYSLPVQQQYPYDQILLEMTKKHEGGKLFFAFLLQIYSDQVFIVLTLGICSVLTFRGHPVSTRYPVNGTNPKQLYTSKLPLIKKQRLFMTLLKDSLAGMSKETNKESKRLLSLMKKSNLKKKSS